MIYLRGYYFYCDTSIAIMVGVKKNSPLRGAYTKSIMKWHNIWDLFQSNMRSGGKIGNVNGKGLALID